MRVDEMIRLLEKLPGDYTLGVYRVPLGLDSAKFQHLGSTLGVNNDTRRVSVSFGVSALATRKEIMSTFEVGDG
jgi:hypothetical protein